MHKKSHVYLIRLKVVLLLFFIFASILPLFFVNFDDKVIQFTEENQILYKENLVSSDQGEEIFKLIYGTDAGPTNLDPQNSLKPNSYNVINQVCEGLFTNNLSDLDFSIIPNLAASKGSWIVNLTDTWYTVSLRPNISFHDGTNFNATAVKFTFDRVGCGDDITITVSSSDSQFGPLFTATTSNSITVSSNQSDVTYEMGYSYSGGVFPVDVPITFTYESCGSTVVQNGFITLT